MAFLTHSTIRHSIVPFYGLRLRDLLALAKQRRQLAQLDNASLKDMGLTRREAETEASRGFFDLPENYRK